MTISYGTDINFYIQKILGIDHINQNNNPEDLRLAVINGFPFSVYDSMQKEIELSQNQLSTILGISPQTIARRKQDNRFTTLESDILYRVARVAASTIAIFGEIEKARTWLKRPSSRQIIPYGAADRAKIAEVKHQVVRVG